jgi:hypothetical protein
MDHRTITGRTRQRSTFFPSRKVKTTRKPDRCQVHTFCTLSDRKDEAKKNKELPPYFNKNIYFGGETKI